MASRRGDDDEPLWPMRLTWFIAGAWAGCFATTLAADGITVETAVLLVITLVTAVPALTVVTLMLFLILARPLEAVIAGVRGRRRDETRTSMPSTPTRP